MAATGNSPAPPADAQRLTGDGIWHQLSDPTNDPRLHSARPGSISLRRSNTRVIDLMSLIPATHLEETTRVRLFEASACQTTCMKLEGARSSSMLYLGFGRTDKPCFNSSVTTFNSRVPQMNRRLLCLCLISACMFAVLSVMAASSGPRVVTSLDPDWRFLKGDAGGAHALAFDDGGWDRVDVPHDWSIAGPYDENAPSGAGGGYLPSGISWYRKTFTLDANQEGRRVFVEFDGIMANSEVWVNGHLLGKRPYGYVSFSYEMTDYVTFGANIPNLLAVKTDTTRQPASRWYTGQGIYRHVRLVVIDPVHVAHWGVFATTIKASRDSATVQIQTALANQSGEVGTEVKLQTTILAPDGNEVASVETTESIPVGGSARVVQNITVPAPRLWSLNTPVLYQAVTKVIDADNRVLDDQVTPFGIRTFEFKSDTGFWLNGENVRVRGVCLHHDGGAVGAAVPLRVWEHRLEILRTIGVNAIRTAHNPPAPEFLDLCDRMGFLVMNETFDTWMARKNYGENGYNLFFREWWEADTRDTVLRDRNHPSVILWSVGNEIRDDLNGEQGRNDFIMQRDLVHQLDPTRPVTMGLFRPQESGQIPGFTDLLDVVGINYRPAQLSAVAASGRPVIGTEETHALSRWALIRDNPAIPGTFLWTGIDYLGETGPVIGGWPYVISSNERDIGFGLLDISGVKRPRAYQRQSWWTTEPMVYVARYSGHGGTGTPVSDWSPNDPDTFDVAKLEVYSNCREVEVFRNGESLGSKSMPAGGAPAVWNDVAYIPGVLKAVARNGGTVVATHELRTAGEPARIVMAADRTEIANDFDDVSHVTVTIMDKNDVPCPNFNGELSFQVSGPGKLVALSTGDRASHQPFTDTERTAFEGGCLALIRAVGDSGAITLTASSPGLNPATVTLRATAPSNR